MAEIAVRHSRQTVQALRTATPSQATSPSQTKRSFCFSPVDGMDFACLLLETLTTGSDWKLLIELPEDQIGRSSDFDWNDEVRRGGVWRRRQVIRRIDENRRTGN